MTKILVLDIDENLMILHRPNQRHNLTETAKETLSLENDTNGFLKKPQLIENVPLSRVEDYSIIALSRNEWEKIVKKIDKVNKAAIKRDGQPAIIVKFMTAGGYDKIAFLNNVFSTFYYKKDEEKIARRVKRGQFEFFNARDIKKLWQENSYLERDMIKSRLLEQKFPEWQKQYPKIDKKDIILIDDNKEIIKNAVIIGFSALHNPTSKSQDTTDADYKTAGPEFFAKLENVVNEVAKEFPIHKKASKKTSSYAFFSDAEQAAAQARILDKFAP
ncbi:hypothetical protein LEAN103870_13795 [Legionella anisa]|uniref:Uncharacterized protein n=1 Tax=Legionella anisa TaxID=28082 RepID=A0AAX0WR35_9GAMM|nr:hypothetical protein [Legionella anisa]AWN75072.1 hypothetical protein DLD14_15180 [Legionella anisa]KTC69221.1 hypothetical protein Lani_2714 [Legionella anisa]MBN5934410.1 hypothetical protein [Legionella anisa]MCW8424721.1 hypothetical protein [Legionella anisa]MCW8446160.1 hypothetical protein [Legionella anisa]